MFLNFPYRQRQHDEVESELSRERQSLASFDTETRDLEASRKMKKQDLAEGKLEVQKLRLELEKFHADREHASKTVKEMVKRYPWIPDQKQ